MASGRGWSSVGGRFHGHCATAGVGVVDLAALWPGSRRAWAWPLWGGVIGDVFWFWWSCGLGFGCWRVARLCSERGLSGSEDFDDDHGPAAFGARMGIGIQFVGLIGARGVGCRVVARPVQHGPRLVNIGGALAVGEEAVMADAMETLRQHVEEEAADELVVGEAHGLVSCRAVDPIILPLEGDATLIA